MSGDGAHRTRQQAILQRVEMHRLEGRVIAHRPALILRPAAHVHVLVIEEVILIEAAQIFEALAAQQHATARDPGDALPIVVFRIEILARLPGLEQAEQHPRQRRKQPGGKLAAAVAVAKLEADDAHGRPMPGILIDVQGCGAKQVDEPGAKNDVGIQDENPIRAAFGAAGVDARRKAAIFRQALEFDARVAAQLILDRTVRRSVVDDDDFDAVAIDMLAMDQLIDKRRRLFPATIIDNHHRNERRGGRAPQRAARGSKANGNG